jgi:hypothetical protein
VISQIPQPLTLYSAAGCPCTGSQHTSRAGSLEEPLFAPGAHEAERGGQQGVVADGGFITMEHFSQRAQWLRAGER